MAKKIPRPRPVRGRLPGTGNKKPGPTGPKKPWDRAVKTAKSASSWLNPFD